MNVFTFIKSRLSILDIVQEYASLKKAGLYWKGCCPFHNERTASFTVSPHKDIFYCFGCHAGGDVISFIAKAEQCSALDAARHLIERYALPVPAEYATTDTDQLVEEKKAYFVLCQLVAQWAHTNFQRTGLVHEYILQRGITPDSIKNFCIGYFPAGQNALKQLLTQAQKHNIMAQDLLNAHIILEGKHGLYSPFEDRIIFPIADHLGRICGFGGRIFKQSDERAKYYNSHDHALFNKSSLLFGLDKAKKAIQEKEAVFLVEGYTDVIAMVQAGYINTIATLGTACTQEHLHQLTRYAHKLYVVYDGDAAGQNAIMRLAYICWQTGIDVYVITLPSAEDPASYLQKNKTLDLLIKQAQDIFVFFIQTLGTDFEQKSMHERIQLINKILTLINHITDPLKKELLLQKVASTCNIDINVCKDQLRRKYNDPAQPTLVVPIETTTIKVQKDMHLPPISDSEKDAYTPESISKISQLEKKLFSAILSLKVTLTDDDKTLLMRWLSPPLPVLLQKLERSLVTSNKGFVLDTLEQQEKEFVSCIALEAQDEGNEPSSDHLLIQFYKKQWKIVVHDARLSMEEAQKRGDSAMVKKLLSDIDSLKKKMVCRGIS